MAEFSIAWWNVENLFDVVDSGMRSERLAKTLSRELIGWDTTTLYYTTSTDSGTADLMVLDSYGYIAGRHQLMWNIPQSVRGLSH